MSYGDFYAIGGRKPKPPWWRPLARYRQNRRKPVGFNATKPADDACEYCKGRGWIGVEHIIDGDRRDVEFDCYHCNGTGKASDAPPFQSL